MFLRREDFVTPRPRESTVHDTVGCIRVPSVILK